MLKIRVGLPTHRQWSEPTKETFAALTAYPKIKFEIIKVSGTHCMRARNISSMAIPVDGPGAIKQTLPYDYYLSTDDDMAYRPENIERLIALNLDIVGAAYYLREGRADLVVAAPLGATDRSQWFKVWETGLREVEWTGGGCMLIKKEVFEKMEYPWWRNNVIRTNDVGDICTEDVSFCCNARQAGFKIYCDLDNHVAHIPS